MPTKLRDALLDFVADLRAAAVRISVAESLDAMRAVAAAGLDRVRMREALRAALIKDEADNPIFDEVFARRFSAPRSLAGDPRQGQGALIGVSGRGRGDGSGAQPLPPTDPHTADALPTRIGSPKDSAAPIEPSRARDAATKGRPESDPTAREDRHPDRSAGAGEETGTDASDDGANAAVSGRAADTRRIERTPFTQYSDLEYEVARDVLAALKRRLRVRLGRRLRLASTGRIDFRRTIRAAIQHGGAMADLRFRARRPRHFDLLILTDVSGSVKYASTLMLELVAGVRACFNRVHTFVYVDRLSEAELHQGHLVMTPLLDLYARSDFGRVLAQLLNDHPTLLGRATLVIIMGDARNNRRPARADLLSALASRSRAVIWLNPEPAERWNTGDSAASRYAREVDAMLPCGNLHQLEMALAGISLR